MTELQDQVAALDAEKANAAAATRIAQALQGIDFAQVEARDEMPTLELSPQDLIGALQGLRDTAGFDTNTLVTAVDRYPAEPRFEVIYQFLSTVHNERVRVRARLDSTAASVPTITHLWPGAAFSERECYDLFGIEFEGHANLERLMMPEGYEHHPLRKDFPHQGIEPDRLYKQWDRARRQDADPAEGGSA